MTLRRFIFSVDFIIACAVCLVACRFLPRWISNKAAVEIYKTAVSMLSILFSVFFAALAVIVAAANDKFVAWLDSTTGDGKESAYGSILSAFRFTLAGLFSGLCLAVLMFIYTSIRISMNIEQQGWYFLCTFLTLFSYSFVSAGFSTFHAITFARYRSRHARIDAMKEPQT